MTDNDDFIKNPVDGSPLLRPLTSISGIIVIILALYFIQRCSDKPDPYKGFSLPDKAEYSEIVFAILKQDTVFINKGLLQSEYIGVDLLPLNIKMNRLRDTSRIIEFGHGLFQTSFLELKYYKITDSLNLNTDSLYFAFQNDSSKIISFDTTIVDFVKIADQKLIKTNKSKYNFGYFQFSIPLLNKLRTKAFVRADFMCSGLCGQGMLYILDKRNGKWTLTLSKTQWVS